MSIEQLQLIAPPPVEPIFAEGEVTWQEIEQELGLILPTDYKELIKLYGLGCFGGFIWPLNPFIPDTHPAARFRFKAGISIMRVFEEFRAEDPDAYPSVSAYPAVGGLLPWGIEDTGGLQGWLTEGHPDVWRTAVLDNDFSEEFYSYQFSTTQFLAEWLKGSINISFYPKAPLPKPVFQPYQTLLPRE